MNTYLYCIGSSDTSILPLIQKEFNFALKSLGIEKVHTFILQYKDKIKRTIIAKQKENNDSFTVFNKIKYITAIIKKELLNHSVDMNVQQRHTEPLQITEIIDINLYEPTTKYTNARRALSDLEDMYSDDDNE